MLRLTSARVSSGCQAPLTRYQIGLRLGRPENQVPATIAGLGTLNHTGLSLDTLARRRIPVRAVLLTKIAEASDPSEQDNAEWLSQRHGVPVLGPVPYVQDPALRVAAYRQALRPLLSLLAEEDTPAPRSRFRRKTHD